jgi:pimeloyl-ACP methyl ester carboxylesterase
LDFPGHGDTAHLADRAEESSEGDTLLAGLVAALEGLRRPSGVALVGYSLGARLALQVAVLRPDLVTAVVALGGNPGLAEGASREARLARDRNLASRLREMDPAAFASWLREEWYARASRAA